MNNVKESDVWSEMIYALKFDAFKKEHPELDEDACSDLFYDQVISQMLQYGEYASLEIVFDENLKIIDGQLLPFKK